MKKQLANLSAKIFSDLAAICLSFFAGYLLRFRIGNPFIVPVNIYLRLLIFIGVLWLIMFNLFGLYKSQKSGEKRTDGLLLTSSAIIASAFLTFLIIFFVYKEALYSKEILLYALGASLVLINLFRQLIWSLFKRSG